MADEHIEALRTSITRVHGLTLAPNDDELIWADRPNRL